MSSLRFADGAYCNAAGTRDGFGRASDQLVSEGYPPITIVSGDREYAEQVGIFLARYVQAGDVRGRRVYDVRYWNGVAWYRVSAAGTVAVPGTSNHESRRAADLCWPYNDRSTAGHRRLQQIAHLYGLKWTGVNFAEDWHWEFLGTLGAIGAATSASAVAAVIAQTTLEGSMSNPIVNVIERYGLPSDNGTVFIGLDNGTFEALQPPFANNIRGIASVVFLGGKDGGTDLIPTLSLDDFNAIKPLWAQMCKGRTDAKAVWSELIQAQDENGKPLFLGKDGKVTTTPTGAPLQFNAGGFIASTNALANDAK